MRAIILCLGLLICSVLPATAQQSDIRSVITAQIDAFKQDDFATAFTFAHPSIRDMFRTPENFGRMVTQGYPMVWRPADVQYLELREEGGRTFQDVQVVDEQGRGFILEYTMTATPEGWLISGVRILEQMELTT